MSFKINIDSFWIKKTSSGLLMFGRKGHQAHISLPYLRGKKFRGIHWTPKNGVHLVPDELKESWSEHHSRLERFVEPLRQSGMSLKLYRLSPLEEIIELGCEFYELDTRGGYSTENFSEASAERFLQGPANAGVYRFAQHSSGFGMCPPPESEDDQGGLWYLFSFDVRRIWELAEASTKAMMKQDPSFFDGLRKLLIWMWLK